MSALPSLPRPVLARLTEQMINRMDEIDGDPDAELTGDEQDSSLGEDDFHRQESERSGYAGDPADAEHSEKPATTGDRLRTRP